MVVHTVRSARSKARAGRVVVALLLGVLAVALGRSAAGASASGAETRRVSLSSAGTEGDGNSYLPWISADGRFVAFTSFASNLVGGDTNGRSDAFVHDLSTGVTERVSVSSTGHQANGGSGSESISGDGRLVAFQSDASNLVGHDTNGAYDAFVRDLKTGKTRRVSLSSAGQQGNGNSYDPSISADGRFVAFYSHATNLIGHDTNRAYDIFVRNLKTHRTRRVSVSSGGRQGNDDSATPSISADGRYVAFTSLATNLIGHDTNRAYDIFVRDLKTHKTRRVSVSSSGRQGNGDAGSPYATISADGRFVAFVSYASNLVGGDTNGRYGRDVFVRDRKTGKTRRVSVSSTGHQGNAGSGSYIPSISADGRFVAFDSDASNLVGGDTNREPDVFVRDRKTGKTRRVSVSSAGHQATGGIGGNPIHPSISADGRFVAFDSFASNLVDGDTNGLPGGEDVFVRGPLP
jgi:Tol biopolymer transport system component